MYKNSCWLTLVFNTVITVTDLMRNVLNLRQGEMGRRPAGAEHVMMGQQSEEKEKIQCIQVETEKHKEPILNDNRTI